MMMKNSGTLQVTTPSDREIQMTRVFNASRELVYEALTKPELIKRWLGVFDGWSLPVCEFDARVGGNLRYEWENVNGTRMVMRGVIQEITPGEGFMSTEIFDEPWYPGEAYSRIVLTERDGKTTLVNTVVYASREIRDAVLKSPMEHGVAASYDALAELLTAGSAQEVV